MDMNGGPPIMGTGNQIGTDGVIAPLPKQEIKIHYDGFNTLDEMVAMMNYHCKFGLYYWRYNDVECRDGSKIGVIADNGVRDVMPLRYGGEYIFFSKGTVDNWCAYTAKYVDGELKCCMPLDKYYFELLEIIGGLNKENRWALYSDMKMLFAYTGRSVNPDVVRLIGTMADRYGFFADIAYNCFMHVYYGMIAEENKAGTKLGKLIKLLGIYYLLIGGKTVDEAAECEYGVPWTKLKEECDQRNILRMVVESYCTDVQDRG